MKYKCFGTGSKGNLHRLSHNERYVYLDAGLAFPRFKESCGYQLDKVDFVVCSHTGHSDHGKCFDDIKKAGIPTISPHIDDWEYTQTEFNMGDYLVRSWDVEHDVRNWAYLLYHKPTKHKIAYMTDFSYTKLVPATVDTLILEISYIDDIIESKQNELGDRYLRLVKYHNSLRRAKELLQKMMDSEGYKLKNLIICHLSDKNSDAERIKQELFELTGIMPVIADKGTEVTL